MYVCVCVCVHKYVRECMYVCVCSLVVLYIEKICMIILGNARRTRRPLEASKLHCTIRNELEKKDKKS